MAESFSGFDPSLFRFLRQLKRNNNRDWFTKNKARYEDEVLFPALAFVTAFARPLARKAPHLQATPKRVGGSVMRVYRDVRFSKDKSPYKTNVGIHFRHEAGKDVHAPGFYVHLAPGECFLGAGMWHPDSQSLARIRLALDEHSKVWKQAIGGKKFRQAWALAGDSLKRPPRDWPADHPLIDDLKRKDFIAVRAFDEADACNADFIRFAETSLSAASPLMKFLCSAIGQAW